MFDHEEQKLKRSGSAIPGVYGGMGKVQIRVPALRFPEFTEEWEKCKLEDITINFNLRNKDRINYPMYSVTNNRGFVPQSEQFEDREMIGEDIKAYKIIHKNDFAYNPARINVGSIAKYNGDNPCMISSLYVCFKACNRVDSDWLMQLLKTPRMNFYYNTNGEGGVRVYLFYPNFSRISTSLPIITEQKKIAKFLSLLDERIATQNKIIEKYESLIQAICDTLIEAEQHKVELSFNDFGEPYSGLSGKSAEDFGEGCQYITYMNVYQNQIIDTTDVGLVKINETEQQSVVRYGDILFTLSSETPNEVGMGAVYLGDTYPLYLNSFCFGVRIIDESKIFPPFLAYYISTKSFRKAVFPLAQGSTRFNLQKSDFMKKKFLFPTVEKQNKIYSVLKAYSDKLSIEKNIANLLCEQKSYLLRQLFI